jgi:hypothetical protein
LLISKRDRGLIFGFVIFLLMVLAIASLVGVR